MALIIAMGTFSVMASAYEFGNYITYGRTLLEPGNDEGTAPDFALGERVYGEIEGNRIAYYRLTPDTNEDISFKVETSDDIVVNIRKNGSNDGYTMTVTDVEEELLRLTKGTAYIITVKPFNPASTQAQYCISTSYNGMVHPDDVAADINVKNATLIAGDKLLLQLSNVSVKNLNYFWRVYDDPATIMKETDAATVSEDGLVEIKMNNNSFVTDTDIKVQAVWYYGTKDESTKTCNIKAVAANITLDPYYDTNARKLDIGVGGFVDIIAKTNIKGRGIEWVSENSSIATVSPMGKITGVAAGQTYVKATISGTTITRRILVTVLQDHNSVIGVDLIQSDETVRVNDKLQLNISLEIVNPNVPPTNPRIAFISSNPEIATVSKTGEITGISQGTATITVLTEDGNFKDTCKITVKPAIPNWLMVVVAPLRIIINFFIMIFGKIAN